MEQRLLFPTAHLRLLECWLPLAQEINQRYSWGYDVGELETLIMASAPALARAGTDPEAHGILWYYHLLRRAEAV